MELRSLGSIEEGLDTFVEDVPSGKRMRLHLIRIRGLFEKILENPEARISCVIFFILFVCFIHTLFSIFTYTNACFSYETGINSLIAERDMLRAKLGILEKN